MKNWAMNLPWNLISQEALSYGIDPCLVATIIKIESDGQNWKTRYEPHYRYLFNTKHFSQRLVITEATEIVHQKMSWGYMQVMGAVARELGFVHDLPELTRPAIGIKYGCQLLKKLSKRYTRIEDVVASYNAGSPRRDENGYVNQKYVSKVMRHYSELKNG